MGSIIKCIAVYDSPFWRNGSKTNMSFVFGPQSNGAVQTGEPVVFILFKKIVSVLYYLCYCVYLYSFFSPCSMVELLMWLSYGACLRLYC